MRRRTARCALPPPQASRGPGLMGVPTAHQRPASAPTTPRPAATRARQAGTKVRWRMTTLAVVMCGQGGGAAGDDDATGSAAAPATAAPAGRRAGSRQNPSSNPSAAGTASAAHSLRDGARRSQSTRLTQGAPAQPHQRPRSPVSRRSASSRCARVAPPLVPYYQTPRVPGPQTTPA